MLTEKEIQRELVAHAERIERARREHWALPPISLSEKEYRLRRDAQQFLEDANG
jgi:hypothetical protein